MNKTEFLKEIQQEGGFSSLKDAEKAYDAFVGAIYKGLKGSGKIILAGFGQLQYAKNGSLINFKTIELKKLICKQKIEKVSLSTSNKLLSLSLCFS